MYIRTQCIEFFVDGYQYTTSKRVLGVFVIAAVCNVEGRWVAGPVWRAAYGDKGSVKQRKRLYCICDITLYAQHDRIRQLGRRWMEWDGRWQVDRGQK